MYVYFSFYTWDICSSDNFTSKYIIQMVTGMYSQYTHLAYGMHFTKSFHFQMYLRCIIMATPFVYEFPATFHESYLQFGLLIKQVFYAALQKNKNFPDPKFVVTDIGWGFITKLMLPPLMKNLAS